MDPFKEEEQEQQQNSIPPPDGLTEEEFNDLVLEAQREALQESALKKGQPKTKRPFPKWMFWVMSLAMIFSTFSLTVETFSIPALQFLKTSAKLSVNADISTYKESVVVVSADNRKGTGFSFSSDGKILTNYHVIEGHNKVTVTFPDNKRFTATVAETYADIDLAVLHTNQENLPFLTLANETTFEDDEHIYFIGNPLKFNGIANEGTIIGYTKLNSWDEQVIMMKAPVYRGNSGSPVINDKGEVIGVVFATLNDDEYGKVGLFVPIDHYYAARLSQ